MNVKGKAAIITGAGSGIGRATAQLLAREGASIIVADVNDAGARETVSMIETDGGGKAAPVRVDVTESADIDGMYAA